MSRETTVGRLFHTDDAELPWVYARTNDSGGIFGLEQACLATVLRNDLASVSYAPHSYRVMPRLGIIQEPTPVEFVTSPGDGTIHGATWNNFAEMLRSLEPDHFRKLDDRSLELQIDGLQNMALEGANRYGGGWNAVHQGLADARIDLLEGKGYLQGPLYQGLGWLATNFAEREVAGLHPQLEEMHQ